MQLKEKLLLSCAISLIFTAPAMADEKPDYISLGAGAWDLVQDDDVAADFRLEYRAGYDLWFEDFHPWVGIEFTSDASFWGGFGFLYDAQLGDSSWHLVPSIGAGVYAEGDSNKDLDYPLEFRSQLELAYEFQNDHRLGVQFGHLSNASLGDDNPGTEVLGAYWHIPLTGFNDYGE